MKSEYIIKEMENIDDAIIREYADRAPRAYPIKVSQFDDAAIAAALGDDFGIFEPLLRYINEAPTDAFYVLLRMIKRTEDIHPDLCDFCVKLLAKCATRIGAKQTVQMV